MGHFLFLLEATLLRSNIGLISFSAAKNHFCGKKRAKKCEHKVPITADPFFLTTFHGRHFAPNYTPDDSHLFRLCFRLRFRWSPEDFRPISAINFFARFLCKGESIAFFPFCPIKLTAMYWIFHMRLITRHEARVGEHLLPLPPFFLLRKLLSNNGGKWVRGEKESQLCVSTFPSFLLFRTTFFLKVWQKSAEAWQCDKEELLANAFIVSVDFEGLQGFQGCFYHKRSLQSVWEISWRKILKSSIDHLDG